MLFNEKPEYVSGPCPARMDSAGASGTEGGAVGLAFGAGLLVLHADAICAALAVEGVVLAVGYVTAHAGDDVAAFFVAHFLYLRVSFAVLRHV